MRSSRSVLVAALIGGIFLPVAGHAAPEVLSLERKIPLGEVRGRIDHLAVDLARHRLFVAELGNGSLGVVDLEHGSLLQRIEGLKEPQGVAYVLATDTVYVASGGDGSLRRFAGADLAPLGTTILGEDADNVREDRRGGRVIVGYGNGALALVDAASAAKTGDIALPGHPEAFQLEASGSRVFVNVPQTHQVVVADRDAGRQLAVWNVEGQANFPMALDEAGRPLLIVDRTPPELQVFDTGSGRRVARVPTCEDADDVFWDAKRQRVYVSCGEGFVDIIQQRGDAYKDLARVATTSGARTALFVPELDRLFVAVRAGVHEGAAVWIYRPVS